MTTDTNTRPLPTTELAKGMTVLELSGSVADPQADCPRVVERITRHRDGAVTVVLLMAGKRRYHRGAVVTVVND